jgi:hypothetical protein
MLLQTRIIASWIATENTLRADTARRSALAQMGEPRSGAILSLDFFKLEALLAQ